jgi:hypothetical protein
VIGARGGGKTSYLLQLLVYAIGDRREIENDDLRARVPVPVSLPIGGWDPERQMLGEWAAAAIYRDHDYLRLPGRRLVERLLERGRLSLLLDGLDEMPPAKQRGALEATMAETSVRVVLSCTRERYDELAGAGVLRDVAVIELVPIPLANARRYLLDSRFGDGRQLWEAALDELADRHEDPLTHVFSTPLMISLARAAYEDANPRVLLDRDRFPTVESIRLHLLRSSITRAYGSQGSSRSSHYADVRSPNGICVSSPNSWGGAASWLGGPSGRQYHGLNRSP